MSNIGGGGGNVLLSRQTPEGEKERREMNGKKGLIKASCILKVFVWIITVVFKVTGVAIICLS